MKLNFFDCNAQIGRYGAPIKECILSPQELLRDFAPMEIRRALVFHALSKELHPLEGNPRLLDEIPGLPFEPCWVAMPHHTPDMPAPAEFVAQMRAAGVKAVRLFPNMHNYALREWCAGEMLAEFEKHRVPVFVEAGQTNYDHVAGALESHPELRLIVLQTSYRADRYLYPLMEKHEHLHMETSGYVVTGGIEAICSKFGASRLVFGTASPFMEPGAAVAMISMAQISDSNKQSIASGNLERLLAW